MVANNKVVKITKSIRSINFEDYLFKPRHMTDFTTLTNPQQQAIINIENYWKNRVRNYDNWKFQKHWSNRKESISSRIDIKLYEELKGNNTNKSIQNFVRKFLRDSKFRLKFRKILRKQFRKDPFDPRLELLDYLDLTDSKTILKEIFPKVVSGEIRGIEKELFTLYFTFFSGFSMSYAIRVALIHFRNLPKQKPIKKEDVISLLNSILQENKEEIVK